MKVLVATKETQGQRKSDFCFCKEGEIVLWPISEEEEAIDGQDGSRRCLIGIDSTKGTTTMKVVEMDLTEESLIRYILDSPFIKPIITIIGREPVEKEVTKDIIDLCNFVGRHPENMLIERRGRQLKIRRRRPQ